MWRPPVSAFIGVDPVRLPHRLAGEAAAAVQAENFARQEIRSNPEAIGKASDRGVVDEGPFDALQEIRRRVSVLKRSTPQGRERADRLMASGDSAFEKQAYARAIAQYRNAIARAPDYPEPHFRLAHAYVATRRFNLALKSAMTALELSGTAKREGFSLDELYRGNKFARERHDAMLMDAAAREPTDGGLQFLIGFTLHYDRQPLQARKYFDRANLLVGAHQAYLRHFLPIHSIAEINELAMDAN